MWVVNGALPRAAMCCGEIRCIVELGATIIEGFQGDF